MTVAEFKELVEIEKLIVMWFPCGTCKDIKRKILDKVSAMLANNSMRRE